MGIRFVTHDLLRLARGRNRHTPHPPSRPRGGAAVGQSLAEFALLLPVLLLLVVVALDFGRIYLGYINVQNMARIAANEAANNPLAWSTGVDTTVQARYRNQVLADATRSNCALPSTSAGEPVVPSPIFTDADGDGTTTNLGDMATVRLTCTFSVVTPIISAILGNVIPVTAESDFPVKAGMTAVLDEGAGGSGSGGVTAPPAAAFVANSSAFAAAGSPGSLSVVGPDIVVDFRDTSGGGFTGSWTWDFGDGTTASSQDVAHEFHCADPICSFVVAMTAANAYGTSTAYMTVEVQGHSEVNFRADRQVVNRGQLVTFDDTSSGGAIDYTWQFGDGTTLVDTTGADVQHAYTAAGSYTVTLTVRYPDPVGTLSVTKAGFITVQVGYCPVPSLTDRNFDDAAAAWHAAPASFTGNVLRGEGAANGNFRIKSQSIAGGSNAWAPCDSDIKVSNLSWVSP